MGYRSGYTGCRSGYTVQGFQFDGWLVLRGAAGSGRSETMKYRRYLVLVAVLAVLVVGACAKKKPPVARPTPPPPSSGTATRPPSPPEPVQEPQPVPAEPIASDTLAASDIDALNRNSPFQPVFFGYDEDTIDEAGQQALNGNAALMKKYPSWIVTIEGHSDERGTA